MNKQFDEIYTQIQVLKFGLHQMLNTQVIMTTILFLLYEGEIEGKKTEISNIQVEVATVFKTTEVLLDNLKTDLDEFFFEEDADDGSNS